MLRFPTFITIPAPNKERIVKELLIVISLIVIGTKCAAWYNAWEEPQASRDLRVAGLSE